MLWQLLAGGELELRDGFISSEESPALFEQLRAGVPWQTRSIRIAGRLIPEPRLTAWVGDAEAAYTYSGRRNEPTPWSATTPALPALRNRVSEAVGAPFNAVLCNLYAHGLHSMGLHADAEPELGPNPCIASLSFGATRRFQLRHRKLRDEKLDLDLTSGSLLIMRGTLQTHYRHGVPKQPSIQGVHAARINLTFRHIVAS
ncbi:MAG: hypothetical protein RL701_7036 [Pseudomonadota bacterium]|jgi:alkylated DNA repair dioxygenase AlkB